MRTNLSLLIVFGLSVLPLLATAQTPQLPCYEFQNLDDNQIPPGWTLKVPWGNGGIQEGKLYARTVDAWVQLIKVGTMPPNASGIKLEYDGNIRYSYWGLVNQAAVRVGADTFWVHDAMAEYNFGIVNYVRINHGSRHVIYEGSFPLEYTDYHYTATFTEGHIRWKGVKIADGSVLFDVAVVDTDLHIAQVYDPMFCPYATTNNDCWMDNLVIQVLGGPCGEAARVTVDIKPGSCPNPLNTRSGRDAATTEEVPNGLAQLDKARPGGPPQPDPVVPVAILGTADFDVATIAPSSITLEGVPALRWSLEDVATPVRDGAAECECNSLGADGYKDLTLKFSRPQVVEALGDMNDGDVVPLTISGELTDGRPFEGTDCVVIIGGRGEAPLADGRALPFGLANYPNPFNPSTEIHYQVQHMEQVKLEVFDISGRKVRTLVNENKVAGEYRVIWDSRDDSGQPVASGVYLYRLTAGDLQTSRKMVLLK